MASNVPMPNIDPIEARINETFGRLVSCLNDRRMDLITKYREFQARPADRAKMERELLALKADTEQRIQMNLLRGTQLEILAKLEQKLEEVRAPLPDTLVKFLSDTARLEREIAGVGEIIEEEVPVVPRYDRMSCAVAVGEQGEDPGELYSPSGVAVDENTEDIYVTESLLGPNRVSVFSETGDLEKTNVHIDSQSYLELDSLGYRRNTISSLPRYNKSGYPLNTGDTPPPNILIRLYRGYIKPAPQTQIQPEHKSIEAEKGITEYASNEWTTTEPMAMKMKQGYAMVGQQYECIRRIRGDNYCALRSVIFQILSMCDLRRSILVQFATRDKAVERLEWLTTQFGDLIKNWSFGQNAKLRGRQDGFNTLKDCISKFYLLIGELKNETVRKRRDKVVTELNKRNAGYFETDARLVEFVKFLMFSKAAELYDIHVHGGDIPNWFLFLTLRDNSGSLRDFFHYHLNLVGDSLGLEQSEMFLLGVSLNVRIKVFYLKSFGEEDFETLYPPNGDTVLPDDAPSLPLISEDDRHYNVVYSLKK